MLGLVAYESDSDSDSSQHQPQPTPASSTSTSLRLPPTQASSKGKARRTIFTVAKPSNASLSDDENERPPKRQKFESRGAGSSSLLAMLPPPSKTLPARTTAPRVLGSASRKGGSVGSVIPPVLDITPNGDACEGSMDGGADDEDKSTDLIPTSLARKGKEPKDSESKSAASAVREDFFSLGAPNSNTTPSASKTSATDPTSSSSSSSVPVTSAPAIPAFEPPPPTPNDPYPGYYQLSSGQWAAYEPDFYRKHYETWYGSLGLDGTSQKGFEGAEGDDTVEIDAQSQLDLARKEREERKALTKDANAGPTAPRMNIKPPKIGSRARTRHQLSALLTEAYENREALEEKIAQGRRNRKESGNKYGF